MGFFRRWVTNFPFRSPVQQTDQPNGQIDDTFRWIFRVAKVWKAGESSSWCNHDQQEWKKMANWASYVIASPSSKATLTTNKLKVVIPVLFSPTFTGRGCLWCVCQVLNKLLYLLRIWPRQMMHNGSFPTSDMASMGSKLIRTRKELGIPKQNYGMDLYLDLPSI